VAEVESADISMMVTTKRISRIYDGTVSKEQSNYAKTESHLIYCNVCIKEILEIDNISLRSRLVDWYHGYGATTPYAPSDTRDLC
jgi:hypothetical protein